MAAMSAPSFPPLIETLAAVVSDVSGPAGATLRGHLARLSAIVAEDAADRSGRAAGELEQLIATVIEQACAPPAAQDIDFGELASYLCTFALCLRRPTPEALAELAALHAGLTVAPASSSVHLPEVACDGPLLEELALATARARGLAGSALRTTVERIQHQLAALVRQLELRAQLDAARGAAAAEAERLLDAVIAGGAPIGRAAAAERAAILRAFGRVDRARMLDGLRTLASWQESPGDPADQLAALRLALGPPTTDAPARSDAERRAALEREITRAVEHILHGPGPATA